MKSQMKTTNHISIILVFIVTILVFVFDILIPRGINMGDFYPLSVVLTIWISGNRSTIFTTITTIILSVLGLIFSPEGIAINISTINSLVAVIGILVTMYAVLKSKEKEKKVKEQNEELKKYTMELKNSNFDLEQYAYVASHDLQEPLRNITNYSSLLGKRIENEKDKETSHFLNAIVKSAQKMKALIQNILLFSLIGKDRIIEKVDCRKVLNEVLDDMEVSIRENQAKITMGNLPVVDGNQMEIKRVFQNLISNAIKFKKKNTASEIQIHCEDKSTEWEFSVTDNGIGIAEEYFNKLFKVFQRLHSEDEYPGTGIGLAICKKIINLYNGKIWVTSKPNIGSTFYFTIPKNQNKAQ